LTASDSPSDAKRSSPWGDTDISIEILRYLYDRKAAKDDSGISVHTLSSIPGVPTQRDARVKEILDGLCQTVLVERVKIEDRVGYRLTEQGERYWTTHGFHFRMIARIRKSQKT